jgi:hypothetical protein
MSLGEIALTLLLGTLGSLVSIEIWGWLPNITRGLDEARKRLTAKEPPGKASDRFSERRLAGLVWSASQLALALTRQIFSRPTIPRSVAMAQLGSQLGFVTGISYIAASLLVGGAPDTLSTAVQQTAAWGLIGAVIGFLASYIAGLVRNR